LILWIKFFLVFKQSISSSTCIYLHRDCFQSIKCKMLPEAQNSMSSSPLPINYTEVPTPSPTSLAALFSWLQASTALKKLKRTEYDTGLLKRKCQWHTCTVHPVSRIIKPLPPCLNTCSAQIILYFSPVSGYFAVGSSPLFILCVMQRPLWACHFSVLNPLSDFDEVECEIPQHKHLNC
jgi:hypothetical protein